MTNYYKRITGEQRKNLIARFNFQKSVSLKGDYVIVPFKDGKFDGYRIWQTDPKELIGEEAILITDQNTYIPEVEAIKPFIKTPTALDCCCIAQDIGQMIAMELSTGDDLIHTYNILEEIRVFVKSELKNVRE